MTAIIGAVCIVIALIVYGPLLLLFVGLGAAALIVIGLMYVCFVLWPLTTACVCVAAAILFVWNEDRRAKQARLTAAKTSTQTSMPKEWTA